MLTTQFHDPRNLRDGVSGAATIPVNERVPEVPMVPVGSSRGGWFIHSFSCGQLDSRWADPRAFIVRAE